VCETLLMIQYDLRRAERRGYGPSMGTSGNDWPVPALSLVPTLRCMKLSKW